MEKHNSFFGRDKNKTYDTLPLVRMHAGPNRMETDIKEEEIEKYPTEIVAMDSIVRFEPEVKMKKEKSKEIVRDLVELIINGHENDIPPIFVTETKFGYVILDGHHRYHAHEIAGSKLISVKVVPQDEVQFNLGDSLED